MPAAELAPVTHVERTENGRVVTVGISTIMSAKRVIAVLSGYELSQTAGLVINGPIVPMVPASYCSCIPIPFSCWTKTQPSRYNRLRNGAGDGGTELGIHRV
jgi:hypothetical protein